MDLELTREVRDEPDVRHRVRQLRWFRTSFRHHARLVGRRYGLSFEIDESLLTAAFLNWAEAFSTSRAYAAVDRRDFVTFSAGLLLRELLRLAPVRVPAQADALAPPTEERAAADGDWAIAHTWPAGFLCTNYCVCILAAVMEQEGMTLTLPTVADDLRTWWSYRENAREDPSQAIAFLDLLTGSEPNWYMPDSVASRGAMRRAIETGIVPAQPVLTTAA